MEQKTTDLKDIIVKEGTERPRSTTRRRFSGGYIVRLAIRKHRPLDKTERKGSLDSAKNIKTKRKKKGIHAAAVQNLGTKVATSVRAG